MIKLWAIPTSPHTFLVCFLNYTDKVSSFLPSLLENSTITLRELKRRKDAQMSRKIMWINCLPISIFLSEDRDHMFCNTIWWSMQNSLCVSGKSYFVFSKMNNGYVHQILCEHHGLTYTSIKWIFHSITILSIAIHIKKCNRVV